MEQKFRPEDFKYSLANRHKVGQSPCDLGPGHVRTKECMENLGRTAGVDARTLEEMNIIKDSKGDRDYEQ